MAKFRTFRDDRPDVETTNPGSSKARREGCTCPVIANAYGRGTGDPRAPQFTTDPACPTHGSAFLPAIEPGQLRCQYCAKGVEGKARFCPGCSEHQRRRRMGLARKQRPPIPITEKVCACGARFLGKTAHLCPRCSLAKRVAASRAWFASAPVLPARPCVDCGEAFTPTAAPNKYCPRCQERRKRRSGRVRLPGEPRTYHPRPCLDCGEVFTPTGPRHRHCGCAVRAHNELRPPRGVAA